MKKLNTLLLVSFFGILSCTRETYVEGVLPEGQVTFWVASNFACGNITVICNGIFKVVNLNFPNRPPQCNSTGTATFSLLPGNYNYTASCSNKKWKGSVTVTSGDCIKIELSPNNGAVDALNCSGASNNGTLTAGKAASGVSITIPYTGGNGGDYISQSINSTGVTGLTASLSAGKLVNGNGSVTYNINGTATSSGTANFSISLGGKSCTLSRTVDVGANISALNCSSASNNGLLLASTAAVGVSSTISYSGGNGADYDFQSISSTGVAGLTATLSAGKLVNGNGSVTYNINGTATSSGTANFSISLGGKSCILSRTVNAYGSVNDIAGNIYKTIQIGNQIWMAENLRTTKYRDGSNIPVVTDNTQWANNWNNGNPLQQPMMCWYNNDQATYTANKFGALYNWYAINPATNGNKNVCPTGWHVPTDAEWNILIANLDPSYNPTENGSQSATAGGKMKSTGTQYWLSPNTGATNSSGWSGLPGGLRYYNGSFYSVGNYGGWWSSTEYGTASAWLRYLTYYDGGVDRGGDYKTYGFSVRCLRD